MPDPLIPPCHITLIVGLPGSGKTHLGQRLAAESQRPFHDDAETLPEGNPGPGFVLAHPALCQPAALSHAQKAIVQRWPHAHVDVIFFANDPDAARRNAAQRPGRQVNDFIRLLSMHYNPPTDALPVWCPSGS